MLTPSAVQNAKPQAKAYKLADERSMFLLVTPAGGKLWRFKYRRPDNRKENLLSLGAYPDVTLKRAREKRDEARALLADGIDPSDKRKAEAAANAESFEAVARECLAKLSPNRTTDHTARILRGLERDVFPWLGNKPISKITAPDVLPVLRRIETRGAIETAHRIRSNMGEVFAFAIATQRADRNPVTEVPSKFALTARQPGHLAAITDPTKVAHLLQAIEAFTGSFVVGAALKLAPLVFTRPGELRQAEWVEIDLDAAEWNIPAEKMKMRQPHLVPLSTQAVAILRELQPLTGHRRYVFPGARDPKRALSNVALLAALRRMGFDKDTMTAHGFRAMARTILDERLGFRVDFIEHQLAHAVKDPNGRAYNRTAHLAERRKMMQAWADYLDTLRASANVLPFNRKAI